VYAADARTRDLPLITGDIYTHDWFNILADLGMLQYDALLGNIFLSFSIIALLAACYFFYADFMLPKKEAKDRLNFSKNQ
jgi:hypothetical protein